MACQAAAEESETSPRRSPEPAEFPDEPKAPLEVRLAEVHDALARLQARIAAACPAGEDHRYERHRVDRPPYCDTCSYCDNGLHLDDFGPGS